MRPLASLLLLLPMLWAQEPIIVHPPRQPGDEAAEPPARFELRAGEWSVPVILGQTFTLPDDLAGAECRLERLPTRRLALPGALAFEYLDGARWLAATHVAEFCWWQISLEGEFLMLQRHRGSGDAAFHRDLYYQNSLKTGCVDAGACGLLLDGNVAAGNAVRGRIDAEFIQEIYAFEWAGATWLLVHSSAPGQPRPLRELLEHSFRFAAAR